MKGAKFLWSALIVLLAVGAFWWFNGQSFTFKAPQECGADPTDKDCFCFEGFEKETISGYYKTLYACNTATPVIDVKSEDFDSEFLNTVKTELTSLYPDCNMIQCNQGNANWKMSYGYYIGEAGKEQPKLTAYAECNQNELDRFAGIVFDTDTGLVRRSFCYDYVDVVGNDGIGDKPAIITAGSNPIGHLYSMVTFGRSSSRIGFTSDCSIDNGVSEIKIDYNIDYGKADSWVIENSWGSNVCSIKESTDYYAVVECSRSCPSTKIIDNWPAYLYAYPDPAFINNLPTCIDNTGVKNIIGQTITCNDDGNKYVCEQDGTWRDLELIGNYKVSYGSKCPA